MMEGAPQSPEKKMRVDFTRGDGKPQFVEITEKSPGVYVITNTDLITKLPVEGQYDANTIAFHPGDKEGVEILQMNDRDLEYYDMFGWVSHFKLNDIEVDATDQDNIVIKAPSLDRAVEILKTVNPKSYDWRDR